MNAFKIVICGESGVGKTAYVRKLLTGEFERTHVSTLGVEVHPLVVKTNIGTLVFALWDLAGRAEFRGMGDMYFTGADAAIVVRTEDMERGNCGWEGGMRERKFGGYITVVNKCDANKPRGEEIYISTRNDGKRELLAPFLVLGRKLTGREDLVFLE